MNLKNMSIGLRVKNYPAMCILLEEEKKTGGAKKIQMNKWKRHINWDNDGHEFIITKIYSVAKPAPIIKKGGNNIDYAIHIEKLILDLLVQNKGLNMGAVTLSRNQLLKQLKMINDNYTYCKYRIPKLSQFINISEEVIYEFYELTNSTLRRNLESSLNRLRKQSLVYWTTVMTVCTVEDNKDLNLLNKPKIYVNKMIDDYDEEHHSYYTDNEIIMYHRRATKEEVGIVLRTERDLMKKMGFDNKPEIIKNGKWKEFKDEVNELLLKGINVLFYYDSYEIICNKEHIEDAWDDLYDYLLEDKDKAREQMQLNSKLISRLNNNALKRGIKAREVYRIKSKDESEITKKIEMRNNSKYAEDNKKLNKVLINTNSENIRKKIRYTKINKNKGGKNNCKIDNKNKDK